MSGHSLGAPLLAVASGVALGWAGAGPLRSLAWGNALLWGAATVALGMIDGSKAEKVIRLSLFGFVLGLAFMSFGYSGAPSLLSRLPFFAVIGLFCAVCAVLLGAAVHTVRSLVGRR